MLYITGISERFDKIKNDLKMKLSFFSLNKLGCFIKGYKDVFPTNERINVVYKIECNGRYATYIGQACRQLKTRISEHRNHINRNTTTKSVITDYRINNNHKFNWENIKIIHTEKFLNKRSISEMLYMKRQKNSINLQSDTEFLYHAYVSIINKIYYK